MIFVKNKIERLNDNTGKLKTRLETRFSDISKIREVGKAGEQKLVYSIYKHMAKDAAKIMEAEKKSRWL